MNKLTRYSSFEEMKRNVQPTVMPVAEKQRLDAEAQQLAEMLKALRSKRIAGDARK